MKKDKSYLRLISYIAMLALVMTMAIGSTFSWYNRDPFDGGESNRLKYTQTGKVNSAFSEQRTIQTFVGTNQNGEIVYSDTEVSGPVTVAPGEPCYFKSVITDNAGSGDSMVSFYVEKITVSNNMTDRIYIGITGPEKTYKEYTTSNNELRKFRVEDNLYLANNGTIEVYWFVNSEAERTTDATVTLQTQYLVYN